MSREGRLPEQRYRRRRPAGGDPRPAAASSAAFPAAGPCPAAAAPGGYAAPESNFCGRQGGGARAAAPPLRWHLVPAAAGPSLPLPPLSLLRPGPRAAPAAFLRGCRAPHPGERRWRPSCGGEAATAAAAPEGNDFFRRLSRITRAAASTPEPASPPAGDPPARWGGGRAGAARRAVRKGGARWGCPRRPRLALDAPVRPGPAVAAGEAGVSAAAAARHHPRAARGVPPGRLLQRLWRADRGRYPVRGVVSGGEMPSPLPPL